ncbi:MAG: cyclic nucleotide-binding domain-containing protein [Gammaproteobacteria bacterium]|nr:cyclic nucleotide-binding domain-containing protein [Gammaproteobacteria bacterium]
MVALQKNGFRSKHLTTDITLGITDGLDMSLWCYVFASIIFSGTLSVFLPVGILACLLGWILASLSVALLSKDPLHIANLDDQAVVIIGAIAAIMVSYMGAEAAGSRGLATLLCIIALTSSGFALSCYLVGRYRLSKLLELLPFPVVCGFMTSVGWLILDAGFDVAAGVSIGSSLLSDLANNELLHLSLAIVAGAVLVWCMDRFDKFWILPAAIVLVTITYYLLVYFTELSQQEQVAQGWLFDVVESEGGAWSMLSVLSLNDIDWTFIATVLPQMLTIVFLTVLYASMTLTALKADSSETISIGDEFQNVGVANGFSAICFAPPTYTDVVATSMYREFGASSRWLQLTSSGVGMLVIIFGGAIVTFLPKLIVSILIFLFAFQTLFDWAYRNTRGFNITDFAIIYVILGTVIVFGFMPGIVVGIILTVLLFVVRYSMISAIEARRSLKILRSSVERANQSNELLNNKSGAAVVYSLRGFLFFGSANAILDKIVEDELTADGERQFLLMDMRRVTGVDISALNTFAQIKTVCEAKGIQLMFSGVSKQVTDKLVKVEAVSLADARPLVFSEVDFALEYMEELIVTQAGLATRSLRIRDILEELLKNEEKVELLFSAMEKITCEEGEILFQQGELDSGFYILEQGALSAYIDDQQKGRKRIKKFTPGALIGELSAYLRSNTRSATLIADEAVVLYHLSSESRTRLNSGDEKLRACLHELVATVLAERVNFMNTRLLLEGV